MTMKTPLMEAPIMSENTDKDELTKKENIAASGEDIEELHSNKYGLDYLDYIDDEDV
jgi:hypothetical protein